MEKLKRIIKEEIKLDKKIRNKVKELIEELKTIPHYEYLTYWVYRGELRSHFIELDIVRDNEKYLALLEGRLKNPIIEYRIPGKIILYDYQCESDKILSLSLDKDLKTQVSEAYEEINKKLKIK
jgi:hypothetical protein